MSRQFNVKVFDGVVLGPTPQYSDRALEIDIGRAERLAVQAVALQVTGASPTLTIQLEHSAGERNWLAKNVVPEIDAYALDLAASNIAVGFDAGWNPSLTLARFRIQLGGGGTLGARLRVYACGRTL